MTRQRRKRHSPEQVVRKLQARILATTINSVIPGYVDRTGWLLHYSPEPLSDKHSSRRSINRCRTVLHFFKRLRDSEGRLGCTEKQVPIGAKHAANAV